MPVLEVLWRRISFVPEADCSELAASELDFYKTTYAIQTQLQSQISTDTVSYNTSSGV